MNDRKRMKLTKKPDDSSLIVSSENGSSVEAKIVSQYDPPIRFKGREYTNFSTCQYFEWFELG